MPSALQFLGLGLHPLHGALAGLVPGLGVVGQLDVAPLLRDGGLRSTPADVV
jgi:hypothetical protein